MSKFKDASENIKRLQVMFKGLIELAEVMDNVDSIENYITELENKKVSLTKYLVSIEESIKFSFDRNFWWCYCGFRRFKWRNLS